LLDSNQRVSGEPGAVQGKVKAFFVVQPASTTGFHNYRWMTLMIAFDTLKKLLPPHLYSLIDRIPSALMWTLFNREMLADLKKLRAAPVHKAVMPPLSVAPTTEELVKVSTWPTAPKPLQPGKKLVPHLGEIPSIFLGFLDTDQKGPKEEFLRTLLNLPQLIHDGFDLPTTKFARDLKVDQATCYRWRRETLALGWLEVVDKTYWPGKAMRFRAIGSLAQHLSTIRSIPTRKPLPSSIPDGKWDEMLWDAVFHFTNEESYLTWVQSIPGWDAPGKGRFEKARHKWKLHAYKKTG
jgi:hypothetical protein